MYLDPNVDDHPGFTGSKLPTRYHPRLMCPKQEKTCVLVFTASHIPSILNYRVFLLPIHDKYLYKYQETEHVISVNSVT